MMIGTTFLLCIYLIIALALWPTLLALVSGVHNLYTSLIIMIAK